MPKAAPMKLDYKKTFLIGFGFFASSLAWSVYNANVPLILENYISKTVLLGMVMAIDNVFAIIFQPLFGTLSDRTRTKRGRRLPYILVGLPICAVLFAFIPMTNAIWSIMAVIILFNFVMSTWRSPVIALMPDVTPSPLRSKANGVINLMGGVGGVMAFLLGGMLLDAGGMKAPFLFSGAVMLVAWALLFFFVKEPPLMSVEAEEAQIKEEEAKLTKEEKKKVRGSLMGILFAIFFWFTGYNAIETYFTLYATNVLGVSKGTASMTLTFFSLALVVGAIPAGIIGTKIGRKKTIIIGLIGMLILFSFTALSTDIVVVRILLTFAGLSWALININSLPMVVEIAKSSRVGKYTGYYYFFSGAAAIISPPLFGLIRDLTNNYAHVFIYSAVAFVCAFICILTVKHGEADYSEEEIQAEVKKLED